MRTYLVGLKKQVLFAYFFQGIGLILSFLIIKSTVLYFDKERYGIWITLLSLTTWIGLSDIGIGTGLRNKLSSCLADDNITEARKYISTAYITIALIISSLIIIILTSFFLFKWNVFFNALNVNSFEIVISILLLFPGLLIVFFLGTINQILFSMKKSSITFLHPLILNLLFLFFLNVKFFENSIIYICFAYVISSFISVISINLFVFFYNRDLIPKLIYFDKYKINELSNFGFQYFVFQITVIILFHSENTIISNLFGVVEVQSYHIIRQLFGIFILSFSLITTTLWSSYTSAFEKGDYNWIHTKIFQLVLLIIPFTVAIFFIIHYHQLIFSLWLSKEIVIDKKILLSMSLYTIVCLWNNIFSVLLNSLSKMKFQIYCSVLGSVILLPLCILFSKHTQLGVSGIVLSVILCLLPFSIFGPIISFKLLNPK
jgi:O-antigen/teichoic acid export membrane protein